MILSLDTDLPLVRCGGTTARTWWWLVIELFDHCHTQRVERVGGFVIFAALIVAQERKQQQSAARSLSKARARANMFDRACLRVDAARSDGGAQAVLERAVHSRHRQRREIGGKPRLRLRVLQQSHDRAWGHQIMARKSGTVGLNHVSGGNSG